MIMEKIKELLNKNKKITGIVAVTLCTLVVIVVALAVNGGNGSGDRKRAKQLFDNAEKEIAHIKKDVPKMDRDIFITIDDKVIVGFVEIPDKNIRYPVINVFDKNTYAYSLCRSGDGMPWDIEGMTIYGIDSFTDVIDEIKNGDKLIFEDLAGEKYEYKYEKDAEKDKNKVIDYGIKICKVDREGKEKGYFLFVRD